MPKMTKKSGPRMTPRNTKVTPKAKAPKYKLVPKPSAPYKKKNRIA